MSEPLSEEQKLLRKLKRRTRFTQFLAWLALFFTAVGIAAGYKNWLRIHDRSKENSAKISTIHEQVPSFANKNHVDDLQNEVNTNFTKNIDHLNSALVELRTIQDSTQHIADSVYSQVETLTLQQENNSNSNTTTLQDWSLEEVHFLLQAANQSISLKNDKEGALQALNLADAILVKRGSTELLPLRKQISQDFALLSQYEVPNFDNISLKINELIEKLKPSKTEKAEETAPEISEVPNKTPGTVKDDSIVNRVKKSFNEAVAIHKFDKSLHDEMNDETQKSLFYLISLRLETLRLMVLQRQDKSYHDQITRIKELLKKYYSKDKYQEFDSILNGLDKAKLNPPLPDVSGSIKLLELLKITPSREN